MVEAAQVCLVGLGRVGLPLAAVLAARGLHVLGVDHDAAHLHALQQGRLPFTEPGLEPLLRRVLRQGRLQLAASPAAAEAFIIAVGTPLRQRRADLRMLDAALASIAPLLRPGTLVVIESTVPPGTTAGACRQLADLRPDLRIPGDIALAHCPERVLPGAGLREIIANPRLIGGLTPGCTSRAATLYASIAEGGCELTDAASAELAKLAENAFRDVNIAFANELASICAAQGVEPRRVIALANRHPRVDILQPGPGVGGHCLAVDPWFLARSWPQARLVRCARQVNDAQPGRICAALRAATAGLRRPVVACLGLSYKRDVDDLRASPALEVVRRLARDGWAEPLPVEPHLAAPPRALARLGLKLHSAAAAIARADAVLLLVDHTAFLKLPRPWLAGRIILDTRGAWPDLSPPPGPPPVPAAPAAHRLQARNPRPRRSAHPDPG